MEIKKKNLLYICSDYPNQKGDAAFINTEIKYVAEVFENIIVLTHGNEVLPCVETPKNVTVFYFHTYPRFYRYFVHFLQTLNPMFWKEIFLIIKNKKKISSVISALIFLGEATMESKVIKKICKKYKIDLCYTFWFLQSTLACLLASKYMKTRNVCTRTHGYDLYEFRNKRMYQPYKVQMDKKIAKIFFISRNGFEYYKKNFITCSTEKYILNYLGTENNMSFVPHKYRNEIRLLSVSYIVPVKRIQLIIEILSNCAENGIKIYWTHIGGGAEETYMKKLAEKKLHGTSVSYNFLGAMPHDQVLEYYKNNLVDIFITTSESEGLPVSIMEAMSYGIPVIATDVGGICEIVDSKCGWLTEKNECVNGSFIAINDWQKMTVAERHEKAYSAYEKWNSIFNAKKNYNEFAMNLEKFAE